MKRSLLILIASCSLAACNDTFIDKISLTEDYSSATTADYELTSSDYATVANNSTNQSLALQMDPDYGTYSAALSEVATNCYFSEMITAEEFLPAFLAAKYYDSEVGSKITVTYKQHKATSTYMSDFASLATLTLDADDYATAWTGDVSASYLTPSTESQIASILETAYASASSGDLVLVSYAYSDVEPSTSTVAQQGDSSSSTGDSSSSTEETTGTATTVYQMVTEFDGAGNYILASLVDELYIPFSRLKGDSYSYGYMVGDGYEVTDGVISEEAYGYIITVEESTTDGAYTIMNAELGNYIYLSGTYNSFNVSTTVPSEGHEWSFTANEDGTFTVLNVLKEKSIQYSTSYSSYGAYSSAGSLYPNLFKETTVYSKSLKATEVQANKSVLYQYDGTEWAVYSNDDVAVVALQPADYTLLGSSTVSSPSATLPIYLASALPYAQADEAAVVLYLNSSAVLTADEYVYSGTTWEEAKSYTTETTIFTLDEDGYSAKISTYIDASFTGGDDGGFTAQNVSLSGSLTYVWSSNSTYGWKASAYASSTNNAAEAWLVSPTMNFKKATAPYLTFEEAHKYTADGEDPDYHFGIMVATAYTGDVTTTSWTDITSQVEQWSDGSSWTYYNVGNLDLSQFIGNAAVVVAFRYVSYADAAPTWEIKNFLVAELETE